MFGFDDRTRALLAAVERAGSISAAARVVGMDASNARRHIATAATRAGATLLEATRGGAGRGRAELTRAGKKLLRKETGHLLGIAQGYDAHEGVTPVRCGARTLYAAGRVPAGPVELRVPPEHIVLSRAAPQASSTRNALPARVVSVDEAAEGISAVLLQCGAMRLRALVTRAAIRELRVRAGSRLIASIKATAVEARALL